MGLESPFDEKWVERMKDTSQEDRVTTMVNIRDQWQRQQDALRAHATQVDPDSPFWFGLPPEVSRELHPYDDYILAASRVESSIPETDLFAGVPGR
jgi:mycothiol S-conjugate amidase